MKISMLEYVVEKGKRDGSLYVVVPGCVWGTILCKLLKVTLH